MKHFSTLLVAACLALPCSSLLAETTEPAKHSLILHLASKHGSGVPGQVWQERNPGIAYRYQYSETFAGQLGSYRNSYNRQTVYFNGQYTPLFFGPVHAGSFLGLATGYDKPIVGGFLLDFRQPDFVITLRHLPKLGRGTASVTTIEAGFSF